MGTRENPNPADQGHYKSVVISELLCYVYSNIQKSTGDQITKATDRLFNQNEVLNAKKILYEVYFHELDEYPKHKTSGNRSEKLAHIEDVVDSIILLDANEKVLNLAAVDLNRLPRWNPNETDNFAIAEKLSLMQNRLDSLEFVVSENKVCNIKIKDDINHIVNRLEK